MKSHILAALFILMIGILGFIILFIVAIVSGRGEIGFIVGSPLYLFICLFLVRKFPSSRWHTGVLINLPIWAFFIFSSDPGEFKHYLWGIVALLVCSYAGTLTGLHFFKQKDKNLLNT